MIPFARLELTDEQVRMIAVAGRRLPSPRRAEFQRAVLSRLAPQPANGAVDASIQLAIEQMAEPVGGPPVSSFRST
jgi:hypothetical protein